MIKTLEWTAGGVRFLDQTKLPTEESYATCRTYQEVAEAIRSMVVRGAPAIGVAAAMGVALGVRDSSARNSQELRREFEQICQTLAATRPTAVNLFWALERMRGKFEALENQPLGDIKQALIEEAQRMHAEDIAANIAMGRYGAALMPARGGVRFLDQTKLPTEESYATCRTYQEVAEAIRSMVVRGAPAMLSLITVVAMPSLFSSQAVSREPCRNGRVSSA